MERKVNSDDKSTCQYCGKVYSSTKWLKTHEDTHLYKQLNHKVKVKAILRKCKFCSYESDRKSSIDK